MRMRRDRLGLVLLVCGLQQGASARAQMPASQQPEAVTDGRVSLEAHEGKTDYLVGDTVVLDLVFRPVSGAGYTVNATNYGDIPEQVEIFPAKGWMQWQGSSGHDYLSMTKVQGKELRIPVVLNEGFVFREPGHYDVKVTTSRLQGVRAIETNTVGIDLKAMPAEVERARVQAIVDESGGGDVQTRNGYSAQGEAYARLAALTGDDALRLKVKLILDQDEEFRTYAPEALASTANLPLQLSLLEAAWSDPRQEPVYDLLSELEETHRLMRGEAEPGWRMVLAPREPTESDQQVARERARYVDTLVQSLPARSGENRSHALYLLFETMPLTQQQQAALRPTLVDEFPHMEALEQAMLLETKWPLVKDSRMVPALKAMLDRPPERNSINDPMQRLVELDPEAAKPYVLRAICDARSGLQLKAVTEMPQAILPEVDTCLGDILRAGPKGANDLQWQWRAELAGRFATAAILPDIKAGVKYPDQEKFVLPVLLRYAPAEAVQRIVTMEGEGAQGAFNRQQDFFELDRIFRARGVSFPPEMLAYLRKTEDGDAAHGAEFAVYQLSQDGTPEDEALFRKRLARLREEHAARAKEPGLAAMDAKLDPDEALEIGLMGALRNSSRWFMSNAEAGQLAAGCMSQQCLQFGKPRQPDEPLPPEPRTAY